MKSRLSKNIDSHHNVSLWKALLCYTQTLRYLRITLVQTKRWFSVSLAASISDNQSARLYTDCTSATHIERLDVTAVASKIETDNQVRTKTDGCELLSSQDHRPIPLSGTYEIHPRQILASSSLWNYPLLNPEYSCHIGRAPVGIA